MAKKKVLRKGINNHPPDRLFTITMAKENWDYLITLLEHVAPEKIGSDEEDDWNKKHNRDIHWDCLNRLRRTDKD